MTVKDRRDTDLHDAQYSLHGSQSARVGKPDVTDEFHDECTESAALLSNVADADVV